jgi:hypothetical protein
VKKKTTKTRGDKRRWKSDERRDEHHKLRDEENEAAALARRNWVVIAGGYEAFTVLALVEAADADEAIRRAEAAVRLAPDEDAEVQVFPLLRRCDDPEVCPLCSHEPVASDVTPCCHYCLVKLTFLLAHAQLLPR